jgi:hypothetical protein
MATCNVTGPLTLSLSPEANSDTSISKQRLDRLVNAGAVTGYAFITVCATRSRARVRTHKTWLGKQPLTCLDCCAEHWIT